MVKGDNMAVKTGPANNILHEQPASWDALSPQTKREQIWELMQSPYWDHLSVGAKQRWLAQYEQCRPKSLVQGELSRSVGLPGTVK